MNNAVALSLVLATVATDAAAKTKTLEDLFPRDRLIEFEVTIDEDLWDELRHQSRTFVEVLAPERQLGPIDSPYRYVRADISIDGVEYEDVGIRKKGFLGSLDDERPSLKIKLDKYTKGRSIGGLSTLTLNNNKQDRSLMSQFMGYDLFNRAGSPAPRCSLAHVTVNGEDLGVYSHVESMRSPLLERAFGSASGVLFEGTVVDFFKDWENAFECKTGNAAAGRKQILRLIEALEQPIDLDTIWAVVDQEAFYRFWAVEGLLSFWDGYSGNRNNFFVYLNPATGKFHFMPWGADCMFEKYSQLGEDRAAPRAVRTTGLLAHRLYQLPEVRKEYSARMRRLLDTIWNEDALLAETDRVEAMAKPYMTRDQRRQATFGKFRSFIRARRADIEREIDGDDMPEWNVMPDPPPVIGSLKRDPQDDLHAAAKVGDLEAIRKHLDGGVDPTARDSMQITPLCWAAMTGQLEAARLLIRRGADLDQPNGDGGTPLHGAAFFGRTAIVALLVESGANVAARNQRGESPLDVVTLPWSDEIAGIMVWASSVLEIKVDPTAAHAAWPEIADMLRRP